MDSDLRKAARVLQRAGLTPRQIIDLFDPTKADIEEILTEFHRRQKEKQAQCQHVVEYHCYPHSTGWHCKKCDLWQPHLASICYTPSNCQCPPLERPETLPLLALPLPK